MCSTIASDVTIITFFFFNDTATTEIYTLSLHDALPIYPILVQLLRQLVLVRFESPGSGRAGSGSGSLGNRARSASANRSEEHTSELQSRQYLVCRLLLEKKKKVTLPATTVQTSHNTIKV